MGDVAAGIWAGVFVSCLLADQLTFRAAGRSL